MMDESLVQILMKSVEVAQDESDSLEDAVCHSQLAPQQLQRSLGEGRISIRF